MHFRRLILFVFLLLPVAAFSGGPVESSEHEFHVSVMRIDFNPEAQSLEVAVKLFIDDLEESLSLLGAPPVKIGSDHEHPETDAFITKYLNNRLTFSVDGEEKSFDYVGREAEVDVVWCYFEVKNVPHLGELQLRNQLLMEQFEDQTNLVHIFAGTDTKSMLLRRGNDEDTVQF